MISNFQIVQGSTLPWLEVTVTKNGLLPLDTTRPQYTCNPGINPDAVDLTNAQSVRFMMWKCARTPRAVGLSGIASFVNRPEGVVRYEWAVPDTSIAGLFYGRFIILFNDNTVFEWPFQLEALTIEIFGPESPITV